LNYQGDIVSFPLQAQWLFPIIIFLCACATPSSGNALTIENVTFAESIQAGTTTVPLRNAALLRYLKFIKAYVAALYLPEGVTPDRVLSDVPKRLELHYLVSIKGPDFGEGAEPILKLNQTPGELAKLRGRIDRINALYRDVKPGDRYSLTYLPGRGTELALNGTALTVIEGADFAAAYFGIWLGREALDDGLKRDLLKGR
jgi:Chalcone isomerase-like